MASVQRAVRVDLDEEALHEVFTVNLEVTGLCLQTLWAYDSVGLYKKKPTYAQVYPHRRILGDLMSASHGRMLNQASMATALHSWLALHSVVARFKDCERACWRIRTMLLQLREVKSMSRSCRCNSMR